jgi:RNA polymerase sigma factor (sigma-70 family)
VKLDENFPLAAIIEAAIAGDGEARQKLYDHFKQRLWNCAYGVLAVNGCCMPSQHCAGVTQNAWASIFNKLGTLDEPDNFKKWALKIIRHKALRRVSKCWKQQKEDSLDSPKPNSSDESGEAERPCERALFYDVRESFHRILQCGEIRRFAVEDSPKFSKIVVLKLDEDLDMETIAKRIGETHVNALNIYNRGIRKLRKRMLTPEQLKERDSKKKKKKPGIG